MNRQGAEDAKLPEPDKELDDCARTVVDASSEVHRVLGPGLLESMYEEALGVELTLRGARLERQVPVSLMYKGVPIGQGRIDLLIDGILIVELKAVERLLPVHAAQLLSYLRATQLALGLLVNFNVPHIMHGIRRVVRGRDTR